MPKEGQFAKSSRILKLNNFHQRRHQPGRLISNSQFDDYVLARFMLTTKRDLPRNIQESNQRFLIELLPQLRRFHGHIKNSVQKILPGMVARAPWQFFKQIQAGWTKIQHFLFCELKAVPVKPQVFASDGLTDKELANLISKILANQMASLMTLNLPKKARPNHQVLAHQLRAGFMLNSNIDWSKVRSLMIPYPFQFDASEVDTETANWLKHLASS